MTGLEDKPGTTPHYHDHRGRLRERFHEIGGENLRDYELLELILFQAIPRIDTKPIAKALLQKFGSFSEVLAAPAARLMEVDGIGEKAAHHLRVVYAAAQRFGKDQVKARPLLDSWASVIDYCRGAMGYEPVEQFRIVLDVIGFSFAFKDLQNGVP